MNIKIFLILAFTLVAQAESDPTVRGTYGVSGMSAKYRFSVPGYECTVGGCKASVVDPVVEPSPSAEAEKTN